MIYMNKKDNNKTYNITFTEDEIDLLNNIFKVSIKKFNKNIAKNHMNPKNKQVDLFFNAINKIYNAKSERS